MTNVSRSMRTLVATSASSASTTSSASGKRSRVAYAARLSATMTHHPSWWASRTTGNTSCPAPQISSGTGGVTTSTNTSAVPPSASSDNTAERTPHLPVRRHAHARAGDGTPGRGRRYGDERDRPPVLHAVAEQRDRLVGAGVRDGLDEHVDRAVARSEERRVG